MTELKSEKVRYPKEGVEIEAYIPRNALIHE